METAILLMLIIFWPFIAPPVMLLIALIRIATLGMIFWVLALYILHCHNC